MNKEMEKALDKIGISARFIGKDKAELSADVINDYAVKQIESWNGEEDTDIGRALKAKFEEMCWIPKPE